MTTLRTLQLRMIIGVLALLGLLVSLYLALFELEISASLVCIGTGCEGVNSSPWVHLFYVPIAVIGLAGYGAILVVDLLWMKRRRLVGGTTPRKPRWSQTVPWLYNPLAGIPVRAVLVGLSWFGFLFSLFLTYLELFVIHAICTWCVVSAVLITATFGLATAGWFTERLQEQKPSQ